MDQPYSIAADWLSKFHTWPEFIQALWVIAIPVTVLGTAWIVMRGVREVVEAWRGEGRERMVDNNEGDWALSTQRRQIESAIGISPNEIEWVREDPSKRL